MTLAAVLVEPRENECLIALKNHVDFLPVGTVIYVFTSPQTAIIDVYEGKFKINVFHIDNLTHRQHGELLTSKKFWNTFQEENILIFQSDSKLLRHGIENFNEYDFIGAPLFHFPHPYMNGGLSLRRKSAMLKVLNHFYFNYNRENEDIFFCKSLMSLKAILPDRKTADLFSCETIFKLGTLGYHAIEKYLTLEQCLQIQNQY